MRAAVFKGIGKPLSVESLPDPTPGPGEFVLRVGRCGICGTDLHMTDGTAPMQYSVGGVPGHEFAGEVVAVGKDVTRLARGDFVTAMPFSGCGKCRWCLAGQPIFCAQMVRLDGGFSEFVLSRECVAVKLPRTLSLADGALIEPLAVGLHGVSLSAPPVGARVLIIGAGPIGLAALFWLKRQGAGAVVLTASSRRREALAREMGADHFVLPAAGQPLSAASMDALGDMPDLVIEASGAPGMIAEAINCVRPRGTVSVLGFCVQADTFVPATAMFKEVKVQFAITYALEEFENVARVLDSGAVQARAMITDQVTLDELPAAFEALRQRTHQCKVMVNPFGRAGTSASQL